MPRKPTTPSIQCANFLWRLRVRDGVFYADGRNGKINLGKHSLNTRNRAEALQRLAVLDERKAVELGKKPAEKPTSIDNRFTIESGWEKYLAFAARPLVMKGVSPGTIKRYQAVRDHHLDYCQKHGIETWSEFDKHQLEKFGNQRSHKQAYATVYLELTTIKSVSKWLVEEKLIPADCQLRYSLSKPQGTDTYCFRAVEVGAMIDHCTTNGSNWLANLIVLLAHTGMRIGEAVELRWTDMDLTAGVIRIADERSSKRKKKTGTARTTKGRRSRAIPIHPRLGEMLSGLQHQPDGRILHAVRGGTLLARNVLTTFVDDVIGPLKKKFPTPDGEIGFEHGRLHSFRHFFCSQSFVCGASEGEVRDWLGHADSKMVHHYRHLRSDDALRRMERISFLPTEGERHSDAAGNKSALNNQGADSEPKQEVDAPDTMAGATAQIVNRDRQNSSTGESSGYGLSQ